MLQDIPPPASREAGHCVLETERLALRRPTLADVKAIARLADDRRIAENTRRLPHPYSQDHAIEFVRVGTQLDADDMPVEDSGFLAPVVTSEKCVGCGLCQMRCNNVNVKTAPHALKESAIIVHAGEGKDDRISHGSYLQIHIDRQKARQQQQAPTPYIVDY